MRCLLHGFTQAPQSWDLVLRHLEGESLRPALLGHGASSSRAQSFDEEVDRVAGLWKAPAHLIGYSLGARVALGVLARHPAQLKSLILIGGHPGLKDAAQIAERVEMDERWAQLIENEGLESFVRRWEAMPLFVDQQRLSPEIRARQRARRLAHQPEGLATSLRVLGLGRMPSRWEILGKPAVPVTLIVGEHDTKYRSIAERLVGLHRHLQLHVVADVGHNVVLAAPEEVAACIRAVESRVEQLS